MTRPTFQHRTATLVVALACTGACAQSPGVDAAQHLTRLAGWLGGEFNNHEQVWQQRIDLNDPKVTNKPTPVMHDHHVLAPVKAPLIGEHVFYVQRARAATPRLPYEQRVLRLSVDSATGQLKQESFALPEPASWLDAHLQPERFASLAPNNLRALPACELSWRWDAEDKSYVSSAPGATCPGRFKLSADALQVTEGAEAAPGASPGAAPTRHRRLRYFQGWVWMKNAGPTAPAEDRKASFARGVLLHTEGRRAPVTLDDGRDSGYELELALLTYQNTRLPILKFTLVERASGKSVSYTWANTEATLIGMNLGWFQAGFTQKADRVGFAH